jgi:phosphate:Na+ symporter
MMEVWKFLAGLGIFLFGMQLLEQGLKGLAGRPFKKFLRRHTTTPLKGILGGIGVTGVLQSSTLISLMMIAFVGAGVLPLHNAIGVIFGANLGTTATGWIVATLGFDLDIESFALPMIAIGGLILIFFQKWERLSQLGRLILGFGFLFFGLSFMKETIEALTEHEMDVKRSFNIICLTMRIWTPPQIKADRYSGFPG